MRKGTVAVQGAGHEPMRRDRLAKALGVPLSDLMVPDDMEELMARDEPEPKPPKKKGKGK